MVNQAGASKPGTAPRVAPRPLSPHLQVWGWTVTMASSITHRATGVALYAGTLLLALWAILLAQGPAGFKPLGDFLTSPFGLFILAGYTWALLQHLMGGIKHLFWDSGRGLDYQTAKTTAWVIYGASLALTAIIVFAGLAARGA